MTLVPHSLRVPSRLVEGTVTAPTSADVQATDSGGEPIVSDPSLLTLLAASVVWGAVAGTFGYLATESLTAVAAGVTIGVLARATSGLIELAGRELFRR